MKKSKAVSALIYSYIALPFLIFCAGFLKWYFALPFTLIVAFSVFFAAKATEGFPLFAVNKTVALKLSLGLLFIILMVILSGVGNFVWQNNDHATRNTIFDILVTYKWPPMATVNNTQTALVYYIGFWLPSAVIGKLISPAFGYAFQLVWAAIGLFILWYLLCVIHKKIVIYPLIVFIFFSGMDIFGHSLVSAFGGVLTKHQIGMWAYTAGSQLTRHLEWWPAVYQYSSHTTQLFWVFNQCLPVWISTVLLLLEKNNKNLVFIMGLTLLSSTLPFIGLIPVFIWCAATDKNAQLLNRPLAKNIKSSFLSLFTFQNVFGGGVAGILSFLYLKSNIASSNTASSANAAAGANGQFSAGIIILTALLWATVFVILKKDTPFRPVMLCYFIPLLPLAFLMAGKTSYALGYYILFTIFEFLILSAILLPHCGNSALFFITVSSLLIIPFFKVGKSIDFCMRASIPLLVLLCLFSLDALKAYILQKRTVLAALLITVLAAGSITPFMEIARTIEATADEISVKGRVINDSKTVEQVFKGKNFTGKTQNNIFFEIFSK